MKVDLSPSAALYLRLCMAKYGRDSLLSETEMYELYRVLERVIENRCVNCRDTYAPIYAAGLCMRCYQRRWRDKKSITRKQALTR